jgi:4-amino-4-deoxy-L-arabinose transferase-like glycosyltransferase
MIKSRMLGVGLLALVLLTTLAPVPYLVRMIGAILLTFLIPGWALANTIRPKAEDLLDRLTLMIGLSCALTALATLLLLYALGTVTRVSLVLVLGSVCLILFITNSYHKTTDWQGFRLDTRDLIATCVYITVAGFLALTSLSYADYWGDEMNSLLRALTVMGGRGEIIFNHTKGPVEILIPTAFGLLVERWDSYTLRFPFALTYIAGSIAFYSLVRHMFDRNAAFLATLLLIVNGLYLAFGRIVQYQAAAFLVSVLAIASAYRFYRDGQSVQLGIIALLAGVGLLAHYDTLLILPVISYLVWSRFRQNYAKWGREWQHLVLAAALLLAVIALFYLPFAFGPAPIKTLSYLAWRIGAWPTNNVEELYRVTVLYNSLYYVAFVTLAGVLKLLADLWRNIRQTKNEHLWSLLFGAILILASVIVVSVDRTDLLPLLLCCTLFGILTVNGSGDTERRTIYIWFAVSFIGYVFFVDHPRTHLRTIYPPWLVLGALAITNLINMWPAGPSKAVVSHKRSEGTTAISQQYIDWRTGLCFLRQKPLRVTSIGGLCLLSALFAGYQYLLFVDTHAEYVFTYPKNKSSLYWEDPAFPFGSRRPYGMPHRLGWQMIQQRFLDGTLQGDWDSNDHGTNLFWYTMGWPRNPCYPRYYFATQFQQKEKEETTQPAFNLNRYIHIAQVWNRDRLQMDVYEFAPLHARVQPAIWAEPEVYTSSVTPADFRMLPYTEPEPVISVPLASPAIFRPAPAALQHIADYYGDTRISQVRDKVALIGYDLNTQWAMPGGVVILTLYWQAVDVVNLPYKVFVHLDDTTTARTIAQADDLPACGTRPTSRWRVGEIVPDRHVVELPDNLAVGEYVLRIGLYEPQTQQRMDLLDVAGHPQGTSLEVTTIRLPHASP